MGYLRFTSLTLLLIGAATLGAQPAVPSFEVASIKVSTEPGGALGQVAPDRFRMSGGMIPTLIAYAYDLPRFQIVGGSDWMNTERFDVDAKAASAQTAEQMRLMLQRLLAERFRLKSRVEKREMSAFALRVARLDGRLGNQMKPTVVDCRPIRVAHDAGNPRLGIAADGPPICTTRMVGQPTANGVVVRLLTSGMTVPQFGAWLSRYVGRPVVDQTSLMGEFDIELSFNVETLAPSSAGGVGDDPPVVTAVQEQLGLRMVSTRAPADVIVIESVERPSVN
jgi:uncharacterized protein (TIGR03435 family)